MFIIEHSAKVVIILKNKNTQKWGLSGSGSIPIYHVTAIGKNTKKCNFVWRRQVNYEKC